MRTVLASLAVFVLLMLTGCGRTRLNEEKSFELSGGAMPPTFTIDPIASEQKINVSAAATGGEIDVYIFLDKKKADIEKEVNKNAVTSALAKAEKTTNANISATIPANEAATVLIKPSTGKKSSVKLKITN